MLGSPGIPLYISDYMCGTYFILNTEYFCCYFRGSVGIAGNKQTMFYVQVTDAMKTSAGGGNPDEGECIDLVEVKVEESLQFILSPDTTSNKSIGLCFAVMWYHQVKGGGTTK